MLEIKNNELLKNHTTFRVGGPAKYFVVARNRAEIMEALEWSGKNNLPCKVIGGGSNLLVADAGFDGLIIKYFGGEIRIAGEDVIAEAGAPLALVMNKAMENSLVGLEWAIGIPGTIGGAICNNAGAYRGEISQSVVSVEVLLDGKIKELANSDCIFSYRSSALKTGENKGVILSVKLKLKKVSETELLALKKIVQNNLADRLTKSAEGGSAGSTFRNIELTAEEIFKFKQKFPQLPDQFMNYGKIPAAWLIEECGLKGKRIGGAMVSQKHAGKITNVEEATAEQIIMLISIVKQKVRSRFSLQLMEEVEYLGL